MAAQLGGIDRMRTCYCEKCNYEFDVPEELNEQEDSVFCPKCKVNLARILPDTPTRVLLREKRLARARRKEIMRFTLLVLSTLLVLLGLLYAFRFLWNRSMPFLLSGCIWGWLCAMWTRLVTWERSPYAGLFSVGIMGMTLGILLAAVRFSGFCPFRTGFVFELMPGLLFAYLFAAFEKEKHEP